MNIKSTLLVVVVSLCVCGVAYSQNNAVSNAINKQNISINNSEIKHSNSSAKDIIPLWKGWAVGFTFGLTQFDGDIRQYNHYPAYQESSNFFELGSAVSLSLAKQINSFYSLSAELSSGSFSGLRRKNEYLGYDSYDPYQNYEGNGDKFVTSFKEADFILNIDMTKAMAYFFKPKQTGKLSFDAKLGIGYNIYNSVRKNLFSDTYIYSFGYTDEGANSLGTNYGSQKKDLFSSPSETVYIYGVQAKYKLNARINLLLDYTVRNGKTDKWDASIMSTQNLKDKFSFLSMGLAYRIGNHDYDKEWESPIDGLKDDVSTLFVKIDGFTDDADNDGVSDAFDKSPNTPIGVAVDGSGNALDVDMDNVPDYRDADPFSNRGTQVDDNGKELDDDKDGVPNSMDLESNTPVGTMVNQFGINVMNTNYVNSGGLIYFPSIYFNSGSAIVGNSNVNRIATMALLLKNNPDVNLNVIGHTDNIGTPKFNKQLGLKRANAVINYLVLNYSIEADRLTATTKGEAEPLSSVIEITSDIEGDIKANSLAEINRRVDFEIVD
jgi:outer membrane protein OmpA-like peptidoglycan-associated protein